MQEIQLCRRIHVLLPCQSTPASDHRVHPVKLGSQLGHLNLLLLQSLPTTEPCVSVLFHRSLPFSHMCNPDASQA